MSQGMHKKRVWVQPRLASGALLPCLKTLLPQIGPFLERLSGVPLGLAAGKLFGDGIPPSVGSLPASSHFVSGTSLLRTKKAFRQALEGLQGLNACGRAHVELKPGNLFIRDWQDLARLHCSLHDLAGSWEQFAD
ncbi:hypothetical protein ABBQ38_001986 [Trebouxia sp. C0009 RCD-2024]